jgi:hypothetical protein
LDAAERATRLGKNGCVNRARDSVLGFRRLLDFGCRNTHIAMMTSRPQSDLPKQPKPVSAHALEDQVSDADRAFLASALTKSMDAAKAGEAFTPNERYFDRKRQALDTDKA